MTFDDRNSTDAPFCYPFMQTDHKDVSSPARALDEFGDAERMKAFGQEILQALRSGDFSRCDAWNGILRQNILNGQSFGREQTARIASLPEANDERTQILNAYALGFFLAGEVSFVANGVTVKTVFQLAQYMKSLLDISYETLEEFCHTLIDYNDVLDVQLEAFLVACGKQAELLEWKNSLK